MNNRKTPSIRFKGFTDDWEQRKLGKVFEEYSEKNHEDLPTLMIIQGGGTIRRDESDRSLLYDKANLANYKMVNEGDFIVHLRSFEGGLEMATNTGIISPAYHTFHGENTDSRFYYSYFRSKKFIDIDLTPHVYGIRDGRSIDIEGMKTVKIPFTSYEEQKAIGMFIKHLDHLITLHQRKLEKLKIVKKAMLENCFPKNGEKVPKFRFSGFTGDWEQRKLSELVAKYEDPVETPHGGYIRLGIRSHAKGTFHEYVEPGHELETAKMHRVATNKLIFNITFAWEHAVAIANENDAGKLVSHRFPQFTLLESLRPEFLKYVILDEGFHHNLYLASPGGAGRNRVLKIEEALDYPIYYPSLEEQHKIGGLLNKLNDLITLHQRKLEKLKIIKKSFLEKMFV